MPVIKPGGPIRRIDPMFGRSLALLCPFTERGGTRVRCHGLLGGDYVLASAAWHTGRYGAEPWTASGTGNMVMPIGAVGLPPTDDLTIAAVIEPTTDGNTSFILNRTYDGTNPTYQLVKTSTNLVQFLCRNSANNPASASSATNSVMAGTYHTVVGTRRGRALTMYLDGVVAGTGTLGADGWPTDTAPALNIRGTAAGAASFRGGTPLIIISYRAWTPREVLRFTRDPWWWQREEAVLGYVAAGGTSYEMTAALGAGAAVDAVLNRAAAAAATLAAGALVGANMSRAASMTAALQAGALLDAAANRAAAVSADLGAGARLDAAAQVAYSITVDLGAGAALAALANRTAALAAALGAGGRIVYQGASYELTAAFGAGAALDVTATVARAVLADLGAGAAADAALNRAAALAAALGAGGRLTATLLAAYTVLYVTLSSREGATVELSSRLGADVTLGSHRGADVDVDTRPGR